MEKDWTIDTYVLYEAANLYFNAITLLSSILELRHSVAFDHEGHIDGEYNRCLIRNKRQRKQGAAWVEKWYKHVISKLNIIRYSGKLQQCHKDKLVELKFDPSDMPFVCVCSKTNSKKLVSGDSDYTEEIKQYLEGEMKVNILSIQEALEIVF